MRKQRTEDADYDYRKKRYKHHCPERSLAGEIQSEIWEQKVGREQPIRNKRVRYQILDFVRSNTTKLDAETNIQLNCYNTR